MRNMEHKHGIIRSDSFNDSKDVITSNHVLGIAGFLSSLFTASMILVLAVCSMVLAGISKEVSINIGMAAESVILVALLGFELRKNVFHAF